MIDMITAFTAGSGLSPIKIKLVIRVMVCALILLWGGWQIKGILHHAAHHELDSTVNDNVTVRIMRILFIVVMVIGIAAI